MSINIISTNSNIWSNISDSSFPKTAGWLGNSPVDKFFIPKYILGAFTINLLGWELSVSKWKFPLVEKPIDFSEYNNIESCLALNTSLSEFISTWFPWYILGCYGGVSMLYLN